MFTSVNTSVYRCKHSFERTAVAIAPAKYCGGKSGRRTPLVPLPWQLRHVCGLPVFAVLAVFVSRTPRPLPTHPPAAVAVCLAFLGRVGLYRALALCAWPRGAFRFRPPRLLAPAAAVRPPLVPPAAPFRGRPFGAGGCVGRSFVRSCGRLLPPRPARAALSRKLGSANAVELTQL